MKIPGLKPTGERDGKDAAAGLTMPRQPARLTILQFGLIVFLVAAAVTAGAMYAALIGGRQARQDQVQRQATLTVHAFAAGLSARLEEAYARIDEVARRPTVVSALSSGNESDMSDAAHAALNDFPGALRVMLAPPGMRDPDLSAKPPVGYALLDMIHKASRTGKRQRAEVHMINQPEENLNLVAPVQGSDGKAVGAVVVTYPPLWLTDMLKVPLPRGTHLRLVQRVAGSPEAVIASHGDERAGGGAQTLSVADSRFVIDYAPDRKSVV